MVRTTATRAVRVRGAASGFDGASIVVKAVTFQRRIQKRDHGGRPQREEGPEGAVVSSSAAGLPPQHLVQQIEISEIPSRQQVCQPSLVVPRVAVSVLGHTVYAIRVDEHHPDHLIQEIRANTPQDAPVVGRTFASRSRGGACSGQRVPATSCRPARPIGRHGNRPAIGEAEPGSDREHVHDHDMLQRGGIGQQHR